MASGMKYGVVASSQRRVALSAGFGSERTADKTLGNRQYRPLDPAPGTYVYG